MVIKRKASNPINIQIYSSPKKEEASINEVKKNLIKLDSDLMNYNVSFDYTTPEKPDSLLDKVIKKGENYIRIGKFKQAESIFERLTVIKDKNVILTSYGWLINLTYWDEDFEKCGRYIQELMHKVPQTQKAGKSLLTRISLEKLKNEKILEISLHKFYK